MKFKCINVGVVHEKPAVAAVIFSLHSKRERRLSLHCLTSPVPSEIPTAFLRNKALIPVHINWALSSINLCIDQHRVAGCPLLLPHMYLLEMLRMMLSCSWADPLPSQDCLPSL